jgi:hypothetical protein
MTLDRKIIQEANTPFNSKKSSFIHLTPPCLIDGDRAEAFLYPGGGFTAEEIEAIKSCDVVRWNIRPRHYQSPQLFFPEHLDPKSLHAALTSTQQVFVNVFDAPSEAGWAACYHAEWDRRRLSNDLDIPERITLLEVPALSAEGWPPIIQEWSDCSVRVHRVVDGTTDGEFKPWWLPHEHKKYAHKGKGWLR